MPDSTARDADRVDLIGYANAMWARRIPILVIAIVCAAVGFGIGKMFFIKSRADSFLQLSYTAPVTAPDEKADKEGKELRFRTNIAEYKVLNAALLSRDAFLGYAQAGNRLDSGLVDQLRTDLAKENQLARWVRPVFALARSDLRDLPDAQREEANYLVGVDIAVERRSPEEALAIATVLGDYVRDSAIMLRSREFTTGLHYKASSKLLDLERNMITSRLQLEQAEKKQKELTAIRNRYPDARSGDIRQVISVDKLTARYLPPTAQLVGTESQIAELHETIRIAEWDAERSRALVAFLEPAQKIVDTSRTGNTLFVQLDNLLADTYGAKAPSSDAWRDAYNTLKMEIFGLKTLYFERMRFISGPLLNEIPLWLRMLPTAVGFLAGIVLGGFFFVVRDALWRRRAGAGA